MKKDYGGKLMKETHIVKTCIEYLTLKGFVCIRNNTGAIVSEYKGKKRFFKFGQKGSSDIIACSPKGEFYAIECKTDTGKLTYEQEGFLQKVKDKFGHSIVARTVDDLIKYGI